MSIIIHQIAFFNISANESEQENLRLVETIRIKINSISKNHMVHHF